MYATEPPTKVTALDLCTGRKGDNLYSCSLLAIDASTGKLKWYFQFTPHDVHDWDATEIPVLMDVEVGGRTRKVVAMANRNAFYYFLQSNEQAFLRGSARDGCILLQGEADYKPGTFFPGGGERALAGDKASGAIRALESDTGKLKWEFKLQSPPWAGVLSTAGGLVFSGSDEGNFYAPQPRSPRRYL